MFIGLTALVFTLLLVPNLFQEGMFMDGLIYAAIGNNMAHNEGSFWFPKFSETLMVSFHEHPPLVFGIESVIFTVFGNAFYIEKLFSLAMGLLTALMIILIWKKINKGNPFEPLFWLPVLLWITVPRVYWAYNNNMLENTMGFFSLVSIRLLLGLPRETGWKRIGYFLVVSFLLLCSFLSKGFPGLYPLGFFFYLFLSGKQSMSFASMIKNTTLLLVIFFSISALFFLLNSDARDSILTYLTIQVLPSIEGTRAVNSRLGLLYDLFQQLVIALIICALVILFSYRKFLIWIKQDAVAVRQMIFFGILGFSASLPLMVSPRLSAFYLVPSMPFFSIVLSLLISHNVLGYLEKINLRSRVLHALSVVTYMLIFSTIMYSVANYQHFCRDEVLLADVKAIGRFLPRESIVSVSPSLYQAWTMMGYLQREFQISVDRSEKQHEYLLIEVDEPIKETYRDTQLPLKKFKLVKK